MGDINYAICLIPPLIIIFINCCRACYLTIKDSSSQHPDPAPAPAPAPNQPDLVINIERKNKAKLAAGRDGECAICLTEIGRNEMCRILPGCKHKFHADCVKIWLVINKTCPLCRNSVLPM